MGENSTERRWDTDTIGHGVADGMAYAPGVQRLLDAMHQPRWIAEEPDLHLLPHLRRACEAPNSAWKLLSTTFTDAVYDVKLDWLRDGGNLAHLRADIFGLVGVIAEGATYVQQSIMGDNIRYDLVTGLLDGDSQWRGHGHLVRFHVEGEAATRLLARVAHPLNSN